MANRWHREYQQKLTTADEAIKLIKDGDHVYCALCAGEPPALLEAIGQNARSFNNVTIMQMLPTREYTYLTPENVPHVRHNSWFSGKKTRQAVNEGWADYTPQHFHDACYLMRDGLVPLDVYIAAVSPMDDRGYFSLGASVCYAFEAIKRARTVIFEVNANMPKTYGNTFVHISEVDCIIENTCPMPQIKSAMPDEIQKQIGYHIAELIEDASTVQLGFGAIPMAMSEFLKEKKDLGIHTEILVDAMVDLVECGAVTNHKKSIHKGKIIGTTLVGTDKIYNYCHENPLVELYPVDYTNDVRTIAANYKMTAINATLEVDLFGQCVSEAIGYQHYSGSGGQVDFCRGAVKAPEGKAILALPSTAKNHTISRIVPCLKPGAVVTVGRNDVDYIVTEYGAVRLRGKSQKQRAELLISIAHPNFRDELKFHARKMNLI
ncbi:Acyl-CoA hydrolase [Thermosyntropha lipolytica DSM 11003]|uniref:Acyl-CoA hydrolase n=1 Tax=Thermosyntropha lipolytica DSM 11003 TaxID=1123382 RepID=A0A1M5PYA4_9FIRM|nr:acetyl-CoA hydrolase/transferase C-terminal domain-containing protein [Thermosyntropha lipolytica]SHH06439.1 Acyl-CoA hydrolase [Thermosyntropha lipolytica DSM 11003]